MDGGDRITMLEEAQEKLHEARELIKTAVEDTSCEDSTRTYLLAQLEILTSDEHSWLSNDLNIDKVIKEIKEEFS